MDALFDLVPTCLDKGESKALVLKKTCDYLKSLTEEIAYLKKELGRDDMIRGVPVPLGGRGLVR